MRRRRKTSDAPRRPGSLWGHGWNCQTCGLKPYRHDADSHHGLRSRGCARYANPLARRLLGWQEGSP